MSQALLILLKCLLIFLIYQNLESNNRCLRKKSQELGLTFEFSRNLHDICLKYFRCQSPSICTCFWVEQILQFRPLLFQFSCLPLFAQPQLCLLKRIYKREFALQIIEIKIFFTIIKQMGYSHSWKLLKIPSQSTVQKVLAELQHLRLDLKVKIQYQYENSSPAVFSEELIKFNGVGQSDGHQGFRIKLKQITEYAHCKTNRKPYDVMVCLTLLSLKNNLENFHIGSDGGEEQWKWIINYYEKRCGKITTFSVDEFYLKGSC